MWKLCTTVPAFFRVTLTGWPTLTEIVAGTLLFELGHADGGATAATAPTGDGEA